MQDNKTELSVSEEVLEKMAELAALEVDGVVALSKRAIELKEALRAKSAFKGVKVENVNGAVFINIYICIKNGVNAKTAAESVQKNVKEKIQSMTGTVVTKVNVSVADIATKTEESTEKTE